MIHKILLTCEILIKKKSTNVANDKQKHLKKLKPTWCFIYLL